MFLAAAKGFLYSPAHETSSVEWEMNRALIGRVAGDVVNSYFVKRSLGRSNSEDFVAACKTSAGAMGDNCK